MHRVLSRKRSLVVLGIAVLLTAAAFGVHRLQVRRQALTLYDRAVAAQQAGHTDEAIELFDRYLKFRPNDEDAAVRYMNLLFARAKDDPAKGETVLNTAEGLLQRFPKHPAERRKLIELYIRVAQERNDGSMVNTARQHLQMLFDDPKENPLDLELLEMAADLELLAGDPKQAAEYLQRAIDTDKAPVGIYARLLIDVYALRLKADPDAVQRADSVVRTLIEHPRFQNDVAAHVLAARYRLFRGDEASARKQLDKALSLPGGANDPDALLAAIELELTGVTPQNATARYRQAQELAEKALRADPKNARAAMILADLLDRQGQRAEAIAVLTRTADAIDQVNNGYLRIIDGLIDYGDDRAVTGMIDRVATDPRRKPLVSYFRGRLALLRAEKARNDPAAWEEARALLEEAAPFFEHEPEFYKKAKTGIGRCYQIAQNPDEQLKSFSAALEKDRQYLPALVGRADALYALGRFQEALPELRIIVYDFRRSDYRAKLAEVELRAVRSQLGRPEWEAFDRALGIPQKLPESLAERLKLLKELAPDLQLLYAQSLVARAREAELDHKPELAADHRQTALALLEQLTEAFPGHAAAWLALGRLRHGEDTAAILATLDLGAKKAAEQTEKLGKSVPTPILVEFRLARATVLVNRLARATPAELRAVAAGSDQFPRPDQHRLWSALGQLALQCAQTTREPAPAVAMREFALECYQTAADLDPLDLPSRIHLIDLGMAAGRPAVVNTALEQIARVEGPNGPIGSLGQVVVRLPQLRAMPYNTDAEKAARTAAAKDLRKTAERAQTARPGWSRPHVILGELDELAGEFNEAARNYQKAIDLGDRQEFVIRRAFSVYLFELKKEDQALKVLKDVSPDVALPPDLERFRVVKTLLVGTIPEGARPEIDRIAPGNTPQKKQPYQSLLLRGALLAAIHDDVEAEKAFREAVEVNDQIPETWTALVAHLFRMDKASQAEIVLKQAEETLATHPPPDPVKRAELLLGLAACYEQLGKLDDAEKKYQAAVTTAPKELNPNRQLVLFLQRVGRADLADKMLRDLAGREPNIARWARRHRALSMMPGPDAYQKLPEALALVDENLKANPNDDDDIKARALLLTIDPERRAEAVKFLEDRYAKWDNLTPDEFYLLGQLRFNKGDISGSEQYFEKAARPRVGVTPEHLAAVVRVHLALSKIANAPGPLEHAEQALKRLESAAPRSWEATREKARLRHQQAVVERGKRDANKERADALDEEARQLILKFPAARTETSIRSRTGPLLQELGFFADAEALYTELLTTAKGDAPHLPLAALLISRKRPGEAVELAWKHQDRCSPVLTARILTEAVRVHRAKPPGEQPADAVKIDEPRIDQWLDGRIAAHADDKPLLATLIGARADLFDAQRKYDQAIAEYERGIALNPDRADVLTNNLCMILALHRPGQANDAIARMERLIQLRGPDPVFLDTLAVAYITRGGRLPSGEYAAVVAIQKLELALGQRQSPVYLYHLAWAYDLLDGKGLLKAETLARAEKLGLTLDDLHPLEAGKFRQFYPKK